MDLSDNLNKVVQLLGVFCT